MITCSATNAAKLDTSGRYLGLCTAHTQLLQARLLVLT
jgi:hypothetical protein